EPKDNGTDPFDLRTDFPRRTSECSDSLDVRYSSGDETVPSKSPGRTPAHKLSFSVENILNPFNFSGRAMSHVNHLINGINFTFNQLRHQHSMMPGNLSCLKSQSTIDSELRYLSAEALLAKETGLLSF